jgi:hypothetical protein
MRVLIVIFGVGVALVIGFAVPGEAGLGRVNASSAKHKDGPYNDGGIQASLGPGETKSFFLKAKNTSNEQIAVAMAAESTNGQGYTQKWFRKGNNITQKVKDGFDFELGPEKVRKYRLQISADNSPGPGYCSNTSFYDIEEMEYDYAYVGLNGGGCIGP